MPRNPDPDPADFSFDWDTLVSVVTDGYGKLFVHVDGSTADEPFAVIEVGAVASDGCSFRAETIDAVLAAVRSALEN